MKEIQRVSKQFFILLFIIAIIITIFSTSAFATITARIDYPEENGYLYGNVKISGAAQATGTFNSYVLEVQLQPSGQWQTIAQGNTQIPEFGGQRDILGLWETGSGSFPSGEYKIRLTVYAEGASQSYTVNNVNLGTCTYVNTISVNPVKFNPYAGQTTTISYNLPQDGDVTIKFYDRRKNIKETKTLGLQSAGSHNVVWEAHDGPPGPASALPDDAYTFSIKVYHSGDQTTQTYYPSDGEENVTPTNITTSQPFKPELNQLCEVGYTIDRPCWVRIAMGTPDLVWAYLHGITSDTWVPQLAGSHTDYWDGRKKVLMPLEQVLVNLPQIVAIIWANTLPDNVMITEGRTPEITNLQANPPIIDLTSGQGTDLSYTISRDMNVTIKVYTNAPFGSEMQYVRTLVNNQPRTAGNHTEHWDGLSDAGLYGAPPYPYTFIIEAVDADGIEAERKYGSIVVKGY